MEDGSDYFMKVVSTAGRQDAGYTIDVDLVAGAEDTVLTVADIAEGGIQMFIRRQQRSVLTEVQPHCLSLSLTDGDQTG